jgi:ketosteroid isomerase-like protein
MAAPISDHEQVRQFLARFTTMRDDHRFEEWSQLWTEDGTFDYPGAVVTGRAAIRDNVAAMMRDDRGKHIQVNIIIELDGDTADVTSDVMKLRPNDPGTGSGFQVQTAGRYLDKLVRQDGTWFIASRRVALLGME